jgi:tetratricopeptide (TPR) repeat protein
LLLQNNRQICSKTRTLVVEVFKDAIGSETELTKTLVDKKRTYGSILDDQGDYTNALMVYEECLREYKVLNGGYNFFCCVLFGETNKDVANTYNSTGVVYKAQGKYDQALEYYEKAIEIDLKTVGNNHPQTKSHIRNKEICQKAKANN